MALFPEDNNASEVDSLATSLCCSDVATFHIERSAAFLSNQLIGNSIHERIEFTNARTNPNRPASRRNVSKPCRTTKR
jgi:hypothetical protein